MHIHLCPYEPHTLTRIAMHVREFPEDGAGVDFVLRGGVATDGVAGYATDNPASSRADWRGVTGAAGGNTGDGQHFVDAQLGDHAEKGVDCGAAGEGPAGTAAAAFTGRSGKTETRDTRLESSAGALERETGRAGLEKSFAAYESSHGAGG
jgi:hypothetical protein